MYEYQFTTHYGTVAPGPLTAPQGFRLRGIKLVETSRNLCFSGAGMNMHPSSGTESAGYNWIFIWERYVPDKGEE